MSQHRRRGAAGRRVSRRTGFLWPAVLAGVSAITAVAVGAFLLVRPGPVTAGAAIAAAAVSNSRAMVVLEQQRQQMIVMDEAAHSIRLVGKPRVASRPVPAAAPGGVVSVLAGPPPNPNSAQSIAYNMMASFGFDPKVYFSCLDNIWTHESNWNYRAENASGAYGIPQALPGSKMATAGADWQVNPATQIRWGLGYIKSRYGDPCQAWAFWQAHSYY